MRTILKCFFLIMLGFMAVVVGKHIGSKRMIKEIVLPKDVQELIDNPPEYKMRDIDAEVDKWDQDCYATAYEMRNQCPVCSDYFYDEGYEEDGIVVCSEECLKELKGK